jgi:hypothetical protein
MDLVSATLLTLAAATTAGAPQPGKTAASMTVAEIAALTRDVTPRVEQIRGAHFTRPVAVKLVDEATAKTHFRARLTKFWPEERIRQDQKAYEQLGLLPHGTDLVASMLDILEEQAGGYYDPDSHTFFVLGSMPRSTAPILVAHELTHALDDQRFDIDGMMTRLKDDDDRAAAFSAVVEGSGTVVMSLYLLQEVQAGRLGLDALQDLQKSEAGRAEKLMASPPILQRSLLAPYLLGQAFLLHGDPQQMTRFDPAELDRVFKDPPVSTEQLLHPDKYWRLSPRDLPRRVDLPDLVPLLGPGWARGAAGTLGEMNLALLTGLGAVNLGSLAAAQPSSWTNAAATGWGGDAYQLYTNGPRSVTVLGTVWDTPVDAEEFERALTPVAKRAVSRRGSAVVLVAGDFGAEVSSLTDAVLRALAESPKK